MPRLVRWGATLFAVGGVVLLVTVGWSLFVPAAPPAGTPPCGALTDQQAREQLTEHFNVVVPEQFRLRRMSDHCSGSGWMADPGYRYVGQFATTPAWLDDHPLAMPANYAQRAGTCADLAQWEPVGPDCVSSSSTLYTEVGSSPDSCSVLVSRSATAADLYADCRWGYVG
ncbi:hypothetical protein [Nocardia sp. NPDC004722]